MNNPELQEREAYVDRRVSVVAVSCNNAEQRLEALAAQAAAPMYQPEYKEPEIQTPHPIVASENIANFPEYNRRKLESESQARLDNIFASPSYQPPTLPVDQGYRDAA
jgi:hypothetical protein